MQLNKTFCLCKKVVQSFIWMMKMSNVLYLFLIQISISCTLFSRAEIFVISGEHLTIFCCYIFIVVYYYYHFKSVLLKRFLLFLLYPLLFWLLLKFHFRYIHWEATAADNFLMTGKELVCSSFGNISKLWKLIF